MPFLFRDLVFLGFLVLLVAIQSLLSPEPTIHYERTSLLSDIFTEMESSKLIYQLLWITWIKKYIAFLISGDQIVFHGDKSPLGECPALEVLRYRFGSEGYYGRSTNVRKIRPKNVKYRVGQTLEYEDRGTSVIIGWDPIFKGPPSAYEARRKKGLMNEPYYLVLSYIKPKGVSIHGMIDLEERYIPQSAIRLSDEMVNKNASKYISNYFTKYDGAQYIMQPWLQALYPMD